MLIGIAIPSSLLGILIRFEPSEDRGRWMKVLGAIIAVCAGAYIAWPYDLITDSTPGTGLLDDCVMLFNLIWAAWHSFCGWREEVNNSKDDTTPTGTTGGDVTVTAGAA
jgi:uncharacterized membrane protein YkvA (DUF1232 family)